MNQELAKKLGFSKGEFRSKQRELMGESKELSEIYEQQEIYQFYREYALPFRALEDAYITSRYLPREFNRSTAFLTFL